VAQLVAVFRGKIGEVGMNSRDVPETVLDRLDESRRSFVRKLIIAGPFVVPAVASFTMTGLSVTEAQAQVPNVTNIPATSPVGLGATAAGLLLTGAALLWYGLGRKPDDTSGGDGTK
jgi:hypothetical protein